MTMDLTLSQAKRIHLEADDQLEFYRNPGYYLGTQEEFDAGKADWEAIASACEAVIRAAGEWDEHFQRVQFFRTTR